MKGIVFLGDRKLEVRNFPDPSPGSRDVIVQMRASGMCSSDLPPYRSENPLPVVRGHEPCGVVVARGSAVRSALPVRAARLLRRRPAGLTSGTPRVQPRGLPARFMGAGAQVALARRENGVSDA